MPFEDFEVTENAEFFIAYMQPSSGEKNFQHTSMMLGVINDDGVPRLLARVAKTFDIHVEANKIQKSKVGQWYSRIADEGISRSLNHAVNINYQAYTVSQQQALSFLADIQRIENKQRDDELIRAAIKKVGDEDNAYTKYRNNPDNANFTNDALKEFVENHQRINCYVPEHNKETKTISFKHNLLYKVDFSGPRIAGEDDKTTDLANKAKVISIRNSCRTSAVNIVEKILGFTKTVAKYNFLSKPKHKTKLCAGQPGNKPCAIFMDKIPTLSNIPFGEFDHGYVRVKIGDANTYYYADKRTKTLTKVTTKPAIEAVVASKIFGAANFEPEGKNTNTLSTSDFKKITDEWNFPKPEKTMSFYLLPNPPNMFKKSTHETAVLDQLYKRLEKIPTLDPDSPETQKKFNALKTLYKEVAGPTSNKTAFELLAHVIDYENKNASLFDHRSKGFFNAWRKTSTQKTFNEIKENLAHEVKKNKASNQPEKTLSNNTIPKQP